MSLRGQPIQTCNSQSLQNLLFQQHSTGLNACQYFIEPIEEVMLGKYIARSVNLTASEVL